MPEICEVVMTTHYLLSKIKNRFITAIQVLSGRYLRKKIDGFDLIEKNQPLQVINIDSKGKFLWFELKAEKTNKIIYILNTFGMSGGWGFNNYNHNRVQLTIKNSLDDKDDKKYRLFYFDQRNFGTIKITDDKKDLDKKLDELGRDFLKTEYTKEDFLKWVEEYIQNKGKDLPLYELLMTQTKKGLGSGLGNYLTPEVLYNAKLSPHRKIKSLSKQEILNLGESIRYITKLCYYNNKQGYMEYFDDYIDKHKEGVDLGKYPDFHKDIKLGKKNFQFLVYGQETDPLGNTVQRDKSKIDRTIHWVPSVQK